MPVCRKVFAPIRRFARTVWALRQWLVRGFSAPESAVCEMAGAK